MDQEIYQIIGQANLAASGLKRKEKEVRSKKFHKLAEHEIEELNKIDELAYKTLQEDRKVVDPAFGEAREKG